MGIYNETWADLILGVLVQYKPALYQIQITLSDPSLLGFDTACK
jgi:hypothetical protein